ncbi:hypothetical protein IJ096_02700 [Candidatus Saccharibacteria bacterium]|nr:hypothetical protein [Candidatus Saccharibacteria bacterium]
MQQVSPTETKILLDLLAHTRSIPGDVVELGCYKADTSVLFQKYLESVAKSTSPISNPSQNTQESITISSTPLAPKRLWLYDSFAGLPAKTSADNSVAGDQFKEGELLVTKKYVITKFKKAGLKLPIIKKAFFKDLDPETDLPHIISFAFLDGDLYESIKTSLRLVVPKISPGGIIVVHDYNNPELPGSARAVDEYLSRHPKNSPALQVQETLAILRY